MRIRLAHPGELQLTPEQRAGYADDQPGLAGPDGAHVAQLRQQSRNRPVALDMHPESDVS